VHAFEFGIAWEVSGLPRRNFDGWYDFAVVNAEPGPLKSLGGFTCKRAPGSRGFRNRRYGFP
jgi:hypothetical protein